MTSALLVVPSQTTLTQPQRAAVRAIWRKRAETDVAIAAQLYIDDGWRVVPLQRGSKKISMVGWGKLERRATAAMEASA